MVATIVTCESDQKDEEELIIRSGIGLAVTAQVAESKTYCVQMLASIVTACIL
ncbi:unnamed protein product [Dovyalis caffra]|uniref:Uncharacterized protein n=1 Tax=Dovyalis caffra TaxID=77055 RepID=A0AAV1SGF9_9ROSI|nr:unnamed protein product [Dovyalis caffra]